MSTTYRIDALAVFWDDHADRCAVETVEVKRLSDTVRLDLTGPQIADLRSDADYYADFTGEDRQANFGIVTSAKATVRRIDKQFTKAEIAEFTAQWHVEETANRKAYEESDAGIAAAARLAAAEEARIAAAAARIDRFAAGEFVEGDVLKAPGFVVGHVSSGMVSVRIVKVVELSGGHRSLRVVLNIGHGNRLPFRMTLAEAVGANP
jgi:hypothetical protein